jgi:hypothetical protein
MIPTARRPGEAFTPLPGISARWILYPTVFMFVLPPATTTIEATSPAGGACFRLQPDGAGQGSGHRSCPSCCETSLAS